LVWLVAIIASIGAVAVGTHFLRRWQLDRNVVASLHEAQHAKEASNWDEAIEHLETYLAARPKDAAAWKQYAELLSQKLPSGPKRQRVLLAYEQALRLDPTNSALRRVCIDEALAQNRAGDAHRHLAVLLEKSPGDAELLELIGQSEEQAGQTRAAEASYEKAIAADPRRVSAYIARAQILQSAMGRASTAEQVIEQMMANNPESAAAHLGRWRFRRNQKKASNSIDNDVARALALAPDDPAVLLAASEAAQRSGDLESARRHIERGEALYPENPEFVIRDAQLALVQNKPAQAESVARRGMVRFANEPEVSFLLADALIQQGRIDGDDGVRVLLAELHDAQLGEVATQYLRGRIAMTESRWATALKHLNSARALIAEHAAYKGRINLLVAECQLQLGMAEERLASLKRAVDSHEVESIARPMLADALERMGKFDEAIAAHRMIADTRPASRVEIARIAIQKALRVPASERRWDEFERAIAEAEQASPDAFEDVTVLRVEALFQQGQADRALRLLSDARTRIPQSVALRLADAQLAAASGQLERAAQILAKMQTELGMSLPLALARLNLTGRLKGEAAAEELQRLETIEQQLRLEDRASWLTAYAQVSSQLGDLPRADACWLKLLEQNPGNPLALRARIEVCLANGKLDRVPALLSELKLIEGEGSKLVTFTEALYRLALARRGDTAELKAATALAFAIEKSDSKTWEPSFLRAQVALLESRTDEAIALLKKCVDSGCTDPAVPRVLVGLLYQRQRFDEIDALEKALAARGAAAGDLRIVAAINASRKGDHDRAVSLILQVVTPSSRSSQEQTLLGQFLLAAGRLDEAGAAFQRAQELAPTVPEVWVNRVRHLLLSNRKGAIASIINQAERAVSPEQRDATVAMCLSLAGNDAEAEPRIQAALDHNPDDLATIRLAIDFYIKNFKFEAVTPLLDRLASAESQLSDADKAWVNRVRGLIRLGAKGPREINSALALLDSNLQENPYSIDDQRARAVLLSFTPARRAEAIAGLEKLEKSGLLAPQDRFLLATLQLASGNEKRYQELMTTILDGKAVDLAHASHFILHLIDHADIPSAERRLKDLKSKAPVGAIEPLALEARLLNVQGQGEKIVPLLRNYAAQAPDQTVAVAALLEEYGFAADAERLLQAYRAAAETDPQRVLPFIAFLTRQQRVADAIALCEDAWKTCPSEAVSACCTGLLLTSKSASDAQRHNLVSWVEEAARKHPESLAIRLNLAAIKSFEHQYESAESLYRDVLKSDPDNLEALNNLSWLLAFDPARTSEARSLIDHAIAITASDPGLFDTRSVVNLKAGDPQQALNDLQTALAIDRSNPIFHVHRAIACQLAGRDTEARESYSRARDLGFKTEKLEPLERDAFEAMLRALHIE
jgi:tetratricopeptide (TPR) repeat protein